MTAVSSDSSCARRSMERSEDRSWNIAQLGCDMTIGSGSAAAHDKLPCKDVHVVLAIAPKNAAPSIRAARLDLDHDT